MLFRSAPSHLRGRLATIQQVAIIGGLFFSFLNNYVLANVAGGSTEPLWFGFEAWRCMFWMELVPAGIFFVALLFIPESPRFLVSAGQEAKAKYPLREARVEVAEVPGKPGAYKAVTFLRPHYQLDELTASLRLVSELPQSTRGS